MSSYLAIDQGSHASRALLFGEDGSLLTRYTKPVVTNRYEGGRVEHDAQQLLSSVLEVVDQLLGSLSAEEKKAITACGIATQRSTVLAWDLAGNAISPILSWQDVRAAGDLKKLQPHEKTIQAITGLPLSAHYGASKLRWLLNHQEKVAAEQHGAVRLSPLISYLLYHLAENKPYVVDHSNAQRTQLMDVSTLDWSPRILEWFELPEAVLPSCKPMCYDYGVLTNTRANITAVCGDQNAALFGAGDIDDRTALVNLGSGAFIMRPMKPYLASAAQLTSIACSDSDSVSYLREATVNGAGSALEWLAQKYNIENIENQLPGWLNQNKSPPLFLNTVGGLGSPWWRQDINPEFIDPGFIDFNPIDNKGAAVAAVIESIVFMLGANLELIQAESPLKRLRVSGGLSRSDGLCQKLANLSQLTVERTDNTEATARGVAWLAAGQPENWESARATKIFKPMADNNLEQRYAHYMGILAQKLDKKSGA